MKRNESLARIFSWHDVAGERFRLPDADIAPGQRVRILFGSHDEYQWCWETLSGVRAPTQGAVRLLDRNLYGLNANERLALFARVGWVPQDGGLISNLKVWENLILPVSYHRGSGAAELEDEAAQAFAVLNLAGGDLRQLMSRLPDRLNPLERRMVGLVRALLMRPDIIVYDALFTGVERESAARLLRLTTTFHGAQPARTSVFLLPHESNSERVPADVTITVES